MNTTDIDFTPPHSIVKALRAHIHETLRARFPRKFVSQMKGITLEIHPDTGYRLLRDEHADWWAISSTGTHMGNLEAALGIPCQVTRHEPARPEDLKPGQWRLTQTLPVQAHPDGGTYTTVITIDTGQI